MEVDSASLPCVVLMFPMAEGSIPLYSQSVILSSGSYLPPAVLVLLSLDMMLIASTSVQSPDVVLPTSDVLGWSFAIAFQTKTIRRLSSVLPQS